MRWWPRLSAHSSHWAHRRCSSSWNARSAPRRMGACSRAMARGAEGPWVASSSIWSSSSPRARRRCIYGLTITKRRPVVAGERRWQRAETAQVGLRRARIVTDASTMRLCDKVVHRPQRGTTCTFSITHLIAMHVMSPPAESSMAGDPLVGEPSNFRSRMANGVRGLRIHMRCAREPASCSSKTTASPTVRLLATWACRRSTVDCDRMTGSQGRMQV
mmetsp:Transcript_20530/g.55249  ORF Transcript_20530/g.55249 Transcript_20530/m.55249 type:complete len:217 (-) Transcript_20530:714-1364(-)